MRKKKVLVLTPDTPDPSFIEHVITPLNFLTDDYIIEPMDSLHIMSELPQNGFYDLWKEELARRVPHYDAFFGFSFGGVIIEQCFSVFSNINKPIILFSTPSFADAPLKEKLGQVISYCEKNDIDAALQYLYQHVYYPNPPPLQSYQFADSYLAAQRVIFGLNRVLATDSTAILKNNSVHHIHLIGEHSNLVNKHNVIAPANGTLIQVPGAGMRVLRDNPEYCKTVIREALGEY